jgi:uncharacterized Ntn-hydrolase superfamily protein
MRSVILLIFFILTGNPSIATSRTLDPLRRAVSTFSIVACDSAAGEAGVAVASRFFAVGSVVPWARAGAGAVATQSFCNTSFGWKGLDLLQQGMTPEEALRVLLRNDTDPEHRQVGIVSADGKSATHTGSKCIPWAGGRCGSSYAVQGNILTGESVVAEMENAFLRSSGTLADRLFAALSAGDRAGGDSRGRQSAALVVVKKNAGYGGFTDRAIDIRVDDHTDPFGELGRLLGIAQMNYAWNEAWTAFTQKEFKRALPLMERAARLGSANAEALYDLAVIRQAAGDPAGALAAVRRAVTLNPNLKVQAMNDNDLAELRGTKGFEEMVRTESTAH